MSSIVFYKFMHQKNRLVIHFDGTAISVFDLKREIIAQNLLGTGADFNLRLYHSELPDLEYELDQDTVPRSSFVLAKRSPAHSRNRFNNASRYVTGKPRINRKALAANPAAPVPRQESMPIDDSISEEDRIKLMFENQSSAWAHTQDELAQHKAIHFKSLRPGQPPLLDDLPPPGYICYRCGKKDHWIKNCPTNNDPNWEGKKIMRTTGIPKLYLKTISKDDVENHMDEHGLSKNEHGDIVDKDGNPILVTEDGNYAIAMADSKTWLTYQEKQQNAELKAKRDFDARIAECVDRDQKFQFLDPLQTTRTLLRAPIVTTPCCTDVSSLKIMRNFNYNQLDLEQLLIENDFHCPNCNKEDIFLDTLIPNTVLETELLEYTKEQAKQLGITDPNAEPVKRAQEETLDESGAKRQKLDPSASVPPFTMPMMPMPMMPMPMVPGMLPNFMPPQNRGNQ